MKYIRQITGVVFLIGLCWLSASASESATIAGTIFTRDAHRSSFPDLATVSPVGAVKAALSHKNGKLLKLELEDEKGFLVYSIELVEPGRQIIEILVDAGSGEILRIERE